MNKHLEITMIQLGEHLLLEGEVGKNQECLSNSLFGFLFCFFFFFFHFSILFNPHVNSLLHVRVQSKKGSACGKIGPF